MLSLPPAGRVLAAVAMSLAASAVRAGDAPAARCTLSGASAWREVTTPHFVLATDVPPGRVPALVRWMEETHALVVKALWDDAAPIPGRVHAVAFASAGPFEDLAPAGRSGYAASAPGERWIVFRPDARAPGAAFAHQLAHELAWHRFPRQPAWFQEGLAQFLETLGDDQDRFRPTVFESILERNDRELGARFAGYASPELVARARAAPLGARELLAAAGPADDAAPGRLHASSWILYHWLSTERADRLSDYEDRLARGEDPAAAWAAAFPDLDPARPGAVSRLDAALASYRGRRLRAFRVRTPDVDASFRERPLASAELHALRIAIRHPSRWPADGAARDARRRAEWAEAFREDPLLPDAAAAHARAEGTSIAAALTPVTIARPADARGWLLLGDALDPAVDPREKEDALRRAVALAPDDARADAALARFLAGAGRADEARPLAGRAAALAPWDPQLVAARDDLARAGERPAPVAAAK